MRSGTTGSASSGYAAGGEVTVADFALYGVGSRASGAQPAADEGLRTSRAVGPSAPPWPRARPCRGR